MNLLYTSLAALALPLFSSGAVVTYSFSGVIGTIAHNDREILGVIHPGDSVSGSFSFDPQVAIGGRPGNRALTFKIGSRNFNIVNSFIFVGTQNNVLVSDLGIVDRFRIGFDSNGPTTSLAPLYLYQLGIEFIDTSASIYDGTQTLDVDLNLTDYDIVRFSMSGADLATRADDFRLSGVITSVIVPEPSMMMLLLVAPVIVLRRKR